MAVLKPLPITFTSRVINAKLPDLDKELFNYLLSQCEGKKVSLTLDYQVDKRSNAQNSFYWPVVIEYVLEGLIDVGHNRQSLSPKIVHDALKDKFLRHKIKRFKNPITGGHPIRKASTSDLTTWEFMDYIEAINIWSAEFLSISIPDTDKKWKEQAERDYSEALKKGLIEPDERNRVRIALKLAAA